MVITGICTGWDGAVARLDLVPKLSNSSLLKWPKNSESVMWVTSILINRGISTLIIFNPKSNTIFRGQQKKREHIACLANVVDCFGFGV